MPASNGGLTKPLGFALYPVSSATGQGQMFFCDPTNFNDPNSASFYTYKVEDVIAGRTPSVGCIIISYTDLGVASLTWNISGTTDQGKAVNETGTISIGNTVPLGIILTQIVRFNPVFTAQNIQLTLIRAAGAGPVSITKVRMEGRVEKTVYA
jgi:hypothetical protein